MRIPINMGIDEVRGHGDKILYLDVENVEAYTRKLVLVNRPIHVTQVDGRHAVCVYGASGLTYLVIWIDEICDWILTIRETYLEGTPRLEGPLYLSDSSGPYSLPTTLRSLVHPYIPRVARKEKSMSNLRILFLAADPSNASRLRLGEEYREIQEKLSHSKCRDDFELLNPQLALRPSDISQAMLDEEPEIVHFSGHGNVDGVLCFEDEMGNAQLVHPNALASLFMQFSHIVKCVILNACFSGVQATAIAEHVPYVIGMKKEIGDRSAIAFSTGFYQAIGAGREIEEAYKFGCIQIKMHDISEGTTPILLKKEE